MAQNAYQYTPLAQQAPLTASQPRTHSRTKYKAAAWTKKRANNGSYCCHCCFGIDGWRCLYKHANDQNNSQCKRSSNQN